MNRVLEPELMDDEAQSIAYARADFSASNQMFVDRLVGDHPMDRRRILDLGCGPGDVDIRLARSTRGTTITAVDGSSPMIELAKQAVRASDLETRITVVLGRLPGLPLEPRGFDAILSKDLLHHLPDPSVLWSEVSRLGRHGAAVYVMDLIRPDTTQTAQHIVDTVAANKDPILRQDFFNSLCAAFTVEEVQAQLHEAGLALAVERIGERHLLAYGLLG
jgi:ubiquinone/menaquinone biosynthesis C-methylase UbiE